MLTQVIAIKNCIQYSTLSVIYTVHDGGKFLDTIRNNSNQSNTDTFYRNP